MTRLAVIFALLAACDDPDKTECEANTAYEYVVDYCKTTMVTGVNALNGTVAVVPTTVCAYKCRLKRQGRGS